jgi:FAS-associated factor 2
MTLLTRIEGPISPTRLITNLTTAVSRTKPMLMQRRALKAEQNFARELRRQQEEAYKNSLAQDRLREETERRKIEESKNAERERHQRRLTLEKRQRDREQWRLWKTDDLKKRGIVGMKSEIGKTARVGIRLIGGERIVQIFPGNITLAEVYSFVECYDLLFPQSSSSDEGLTLQMSSLREDSGDNGEVGKPEGYEHEFMFRLVVPYPRKVIDSGFTPVKNESGLWPSGSIVVEEIEDEEDEEDESDDGLIE